MFDLTGKVALVTGATGSIGGAIARFLHKMGATVAVSGTRVEYLEHLAEELSERVHLFSCNLNSREAVEELVPNIERICDKVGSISVDSGGGILSNLRELVSGKK